MALLNQQKIYSSLDKKFQGIVSDVRIRPSDETILIYIPRDRVSQKVEPGFTSEKQLENLKKRLYVKYSKKVECILTVSGKHQEIEEAVFTLLNVSFSGDVISFFMSFIEANRVTAWVEVAGLNEENQAEIFEKLSSLLSDVSLEIDSVEWINSSCELPTLLWVLRLLKINQPIKLKEAYELCVSSYPAVNEKWLNTKLDQLRKKKLIIREKSGKYVLTSSGLSSVPSGARSNSSDVYRALELGRKKWSN